MPDRFFYRMYRGLDVRDVVLAHDLALKQPFLGCEVFNISSQTIFAREDLPRLRKDLPALLENKIPELL
ncbi:MAG: NAD(P)-dependent oxidoreductase, partial [Bacteroidota bacterium]